jgi:hypothetical protein
MTGVELTDAAARRLADEARLWGGRAVETGGFILVSEDQPGCCVALAAGPGITRGPDHFAVAGKVLSQLFRWAESYGLTVAAQVHSHARGAFLSPTDLHHGFSVDGFVTAVIPFYAAPPSDPEAWGWWRFDREWIEMPPPALTSGPLSVVRFDSRGVRES